MCIFSLLDLFWKVSLWIEWCPLQRMLNSQPSETTNFTLLDNGDFADDPVRMRSVEQFLSQCDWCPYKKEKFGQIHEREGNVKTRGEDVPP